MTESSIRRYPLGTDREELERLHFQHRLWSDAAHDLWRRAGIAPASRVLDIGAGPGAAACDLAELVTSRGAVLAVDASSEFVDYLAAVARARDLPQLTARVADAHQLDALDVAPASFDLAYARWVLCFLAEPERVIRGAAKLVRPGGALCIHDYFNYEAMTTAPRRAAYTRIVNATARSWRDHGGDPDVVAKLPRLLDEAGFELDHLAVHQRLARPGDTMWQWATTWWRSYTPKLVAGGYVTADDATALHHELAAMTRAHDFLALPPVFELLARRRA